MKTQTIEVEGGKNKKAKLFITLERHADFNENMENFEEIKAKNEELAGPKMEETPKWE